MTPEPAWLFARRSRITSFGLIEEFLPGCRGAIDIDGLVSRLDIPVTEVPDPGWDGAVKSNSERAQSWLREGMAYERRRFTLASLVGHLMGASKGSEYLVVAPDCMPFTQETLLASALLMPRYLVQPRMYETWMSVDEMASFFGVSVVAMGSRLDWIRSGAEDP